MLIRKDQAKFVDKGLKKIIKYTSLDKSLEINHMILNGRTPEKEDQFLCETKVHCMMLIIRGSGKMYVGEDIFEVSEGDCIDVSAGTKFAAEGHNFEYITAESPAWYPEQATIVDKNGQILEK